jgi:hypothetical protein
LSNVHCDCDATASWQRPLVQLSPIAHAASLPHVARHFPLEHFALAPHTLSSWQSATPPVPQVVAPWSTHTPFVQV